MNLNDLKKALEAKIKEFDEAKEIKKDRIELRRIYKEIKELQYKKVLAEISRENN